MIGVIAKLDPDDPEDVKKHEAIQKLADAIDLTISDSGLLIVDVLNCLGLCLASNLGTEHLDAGFRILYEVARKNALQIESDDMTEAKKGLLN